MFINFLQQKRKCPKTKKIAQNIESGIFETLKNNSLVELEKNIYLNSIVEEGTSSKDMNYRMIAKVMCKVGFGWVNYSSPAPAPLQQKKQTNKPTNQPTKREKTEKKETQQKKKNPRKPWKQKP